MAHLNYYLDICAEVFIVNESAVLLRLHEKYQLWNGPGGHIDPGEDANEAVLREVWEEVGLNVTLIGPENWVKSDTESNQDLVPPIFMNRHKTNDTHSHSALIFAAQSDSRTIDPQLKEDEGVECVWVTEEELDDMYATDKKLRPESYRYAKMALKLCQ